MVRSDITVITNVRLDHQDEMGETLDEIADSLALTIPENGVLITAEQQPELRERLARRAAELGTSTVHADPGWVSEHDMAGFDYLQFKQNIAVGLALADIVGIPREDAMRGMWNSVPDRGVVRLRTYDIRGKEVLWVPLFAANDRESVVGMLEDLRPMFEPGSAVVAVLNNRRDRGRRAELFAEMVVRDLGKFFDHIVLFGAYEESIAAKIIAGGIPADRVHRMGDAGNPGLDEILDGIAGLMPGDSGVLIGLANIHTRQAETLGAYFDRQLGDAYVDEIEMSRDPVRLPMVQRRVRWQAARRDVE
jgi:poly-gamma-glutamate synthase PgsB/CapB